MRARGGLVGAPLLGLAVSPAGASRSLTVSYNHADVPGAKLARAEASADEIYQAARIAITWVECPRSDTDTARHRACEQANRDHVLTMEMFRVAETLRLWEHVVMGRTMAHEIAHMLLGENSDAAAGVTRDRFDWRDLKAATTRFLFEPEQAAHIREVVAPAKTATADSARVTH